LKKPEPEQESLFAKLNPAAQIERVLAAEMALILVAHVVDPLGFPMNPGEPKLVAEQLGKRLAELARKRFAVLLKNDT
jgi:hypothetical protein